MNFRAFKPIVFFVLIGLMLVTAACGGGAATPTAQPAAPTEAPAKPTEPPAATAAPVEPTAAPQAQEPASGAIGTIGDAQDAIIQIESVGSFIDPQVGQIYNGAGRGSGFIIDPSGLAVTNNHVVTGSALLKVWVGGDQSKTLNARVLGVSECSDLAVIDIEGDGFPYLDWYDGPIDVGKEIYVAGFPLGDPEYSLTKGIISKAKADGETSWASVDSVISITTPPPTPAIPAARSDRGRPSCRNTLCRQRRHPPGFWNF